MEWKAIDGYDGAYLVNRLGEVKSVKRYGMRETHILKPGKSVAGYWIVALSKKSKMRSFQIHALIAKYFIPNPLNLPCINHKDSNRLNNKISNLEWCTHAHNVLHGYLQGFNNPNKLNQKTSNHTGVGMARGKWRAFICRLNKFIHVGYFKTEREAFLARKKYLKNHPELTY